MSANNTTTTIPGALPAGFRFNEFEIQDVIGGGGFGIVYRAWDHQLERTVAIKEYMPVSLAMRSEEGHDLVLRGERFQKLFSAGLNSFIQESRLLARFNHPGLLHVLRFWEQNGTAYMCTLYYSGMTLKAWQQQSPATIDEAWIRRLLPPLFGAISTIHREGYLHRDISLDNIQIQENQLPVLLDFGSARKEIGNLSDETEIMLKPGFAPIEQYSEEAESDQGPWTDIYALGAVLHSLIVGTPPPASVVRCIEDSYQSLTQRGLQGFSLPLLHAIDRALAMKPQDRPATIDEFASLIHLPVSDVESVIGKLTPAAVEKAPREPAEPVVVAINPTAPMAESLPIKPVRRLSPLLTCVAAVAVLAVGVTVWLVKRQPANVMPLPVTSAARPVAAPSLATVYLPLAANETITLNGQKLAVKASSNGFAALSLPAGDYQFEIGKGSSVRRQSLTITHAGTWLIAPGKG
ncbi:serine/threonine protein kinase [Pantoea sp. A4]|uniref:serine/threonine protein kinase n=1 Tax=Pantoea sp. A4 TaxID=1225184 RepID=UPI000360DA61|nr:serine/threonine-protein kinase [Pantoea sp. A4]